MKYLLAVVLLVTLSSKISLQQCSPHSPPSLDYKCLLNNREVPCDDVCQQYRLTPQSKNTQMSDKPTECSPIMCGVANKSLVPLAYSYMPDTAQQGQVPWQAELYMRKMPDGRISPTWTMMCGGTLISNHLVLTAAHCLKYGTPDTVLKPEEIKVGLGKIQRLYNNLEPNSIHSNVREVLLPQHFMGDATAYMQDIALLDLEQPVKMSEYILPACVDWDNIFKMKTGDNVHISGWGRTEGGDLIDVLRVGEMTYLENIDCVGKFSHVLRRYVTPDKFCAEPKPGKEPLNLQGSSGSGVTTVMDGRHYVIGVVSTQIRSQKKILMFTNISNEEHHSWIKSEKARLDNFHRIRN